MRFEVITRGTGFKKLFGNSDLLGIILSYLGAVDLCKLACVSRHLLEDSMSNHLWKKIISSDFIASEFDGNTSSKLSYIRQYNLMLQRVNRAKVEKFQILSDINKDKKILYLECFLDMTQMRFMITLPSLALFLTVLLIALRFDGNKYISSWACFSPILIFLIYILINIGIGYILYRNQYSRISIMNGIWSQMSGPIYYIYTEFLSQSLYGVHVAITSLLLIILEIILLSAKLSGNHISLSILQIPWGVVFIPLWCIFLLSASGPLLLTFREMGFYYLYMMFIWLPSFVFFVCLTVKLSGEDDKSSHGNIKLSLIFMPLWIIEGSLMVATLSFLIHGVYKHLKGILEKLDEHLLLFGICWGILLPFVLFQILMCIRNETGVLSAITVVSPLLFLFLVIFIISCVQAYKYKSPFDLARANNMQDEIGSRLLYEV